MSETKRVLVTNHALERYKLRVNPEATREDVELEFRDAWPASRKRKARILANQSNQLKKLRDKTFNYFLTRDTVFVTYMSDQMDFYIVTTWRRTCE